MEIEIWSNESDSSFQLLYNVCFTQALDAFSNDSFLIQNNIDNLMNH